MTVPDYYWVHWIDRDKPPKFILDAISGWPAEDVVGLLRFMAHHWFPAIFTSEPFHGFFWFSAAGMAGNKEMLAALLSNEKVRQALEGKYITVPEQGLFMVALSELALWYIDYLMKPLFYAAHTTKQEALERTGIKEKHHGKED
jgi:hypothetical protein